jgi:hypothetical protein
MKKFVLTAPPETFKRDVIIDMHDGSQASLQIEFKYRSRSEYAQFIDSIIANAKKSAEAEKPKTEDESLQDKELTMQEILNQQGDLAIETIMQIAVGWELSDKWNKKSLSELHDKFPGAFNAINNAYSASVVHGQLKN